MKVSRAAINFGLDATLLALFLTTVWITSVVRFAFPPGPEAAGWRLWGLGYDGWSRVSFGCHGILTLAVLLHLVMHWDWVCGFVTTRLARRRGGRPTYAGMNDGAKTLYGVGLLIATLTVLGGLLFLAVISVESPV